MKDRDQKGNEGEFRRILALATVPDVPDGGIERLLARVECAADIHEVIPFRSRDTRWRTRLGYAAALPLAASLALGLYLGAMGDFDFMLPDVITGAVADNQDLVDDLGGMGEADAYFEDTVS
ncbi:MAG: hypothetical protein KDK89_15180 [Alphaproteobacteria bacterium]|nr:hypothetical protein [Alphaproteobacteria bacterium]